MGAKTHCFWLLISFFLILLLHGIVDASFETYRTAYHFQPPKNWMNDPAGPMVYKNLYHLFYQYVPTGVDAEGTKVWGHSTSFDLVNWTPLPIAISPSQKGDIYGCWTGSATILFGQKPAILYTGIINTQQQQVQNVAFPKNLSDPFLLEWIKPPQDPVIIPNPPNEINGSSFRDPSTGWLGLDGRWRIIVGNKIGSNGRALLYLSNDFVNWTKAENSLHSANDTGMWECPDFFPVSRSQIGLDTSMLGGLGIKDVLKISLDDTKHDVYVLGTYDYVNDMFVPDVGSVEGDKGLRYDYGKFYASKTFFDSLKKRRILWGWINESLPKEDYISQGWSGIQVIIVTGNPHEIPLAVLMSRCVAVAAHCWIDPTMCSHSCYTHRHIGIPRMIWLDESGKQLLQWPIYEIETLRGNQVRYPWTLLRGGSVLEIQGVNVVQADVEVTFGLVGILNKAEDWNSSWSDPQLVCSQMDASIEGGGIGPFGLKVLASKDMEEYTAVFFRIYKKEDNYVILMCSDQSRSSLNPKPDKTAYGLLLNMDIIGAARLSLRTLIDHSVVESFGAKGKGCITSRVYPTKAINNDAYLYVFNQGGEDIIIESLSAWTMNKAQIN